MLQKQESNSSEMKPSSDFNTFEQSISTMEPQGKRPESNQPHIPQAEAVPTSPTMPENETLGDHLTVIADKWEMMANSNVKESQALLMVTLAKGFTNTLFHTPNGEAFASIVVNEHAETHRVSSNDFSHWLGRLYYKETGKPASAQCMKEAIKTIEAECIKFCWNQGMSPLPVPKLQGSIDQLRPFLNFENESDWVVLVSWLVSCMRPDRPFPILVLQGEQGTAKSTTARLLRDLIDPSTVPSQSMPRSERDLVIAASKSWVLNLDNLSSLSPDMSDAFCRISTGGGFRTRSVYTNDSERLFNSNETHYHERDFGFYNSS
jgi:hypothetical protein